MLRKTGRTAIAAALLATFAVAASAQGRPDARTMMCAEVQSLIVHQGAIVLTTGQHTYDRYVAATVFCSHPYVARPDYITTRDGACPVLRCAEPIFEERW